MYNDLEILRTLGYISALRGTDSSGVAQGRISLENKVEDLIIEKEAWDFSYFQWYHKVRKDGNREVLDGIHNNFFMGHVRAATRGAINQENSHPFDVGRFIGAHNGTLKDKRFQDRDMTDSEMMFREMERFDSIEGTLSNLDKDSAYAVTILDKENGKFYMARNTQRPLFIAFNAKRSVMYYASEEWFIRGCVSRSGEKLQNDDVYYLVPNHLYEFNPRRAPWKLDDLVKKDMTQGKPRVKVKQHGNSTPKSHGKSNARLPTFIKNMEEQKVLPFVRNKPEVENTKSIVTETGVLPSKYLPHVICSCGSEMTLVEQFLNKSKMCFSCEEIMSKVAIN